MMTSSWVLTPVRAVCRCLSNTRVDAVISQIDAQLEPPHTGSSITPADCGVDSAAASVNSLWRALLEILKDNAELRKTLNGVVLARAAALCAPLLFSLFFFPG
jgi:shikimate kinase